MIKKVIALDLDGTLLKSDNTISDFTVKTIQKLKEQGHLIIITTGRPYRMSLEYYKLLGLNTPMINFNGSLTHLPEQNWEFEQNLSIDKNHLFEMLKQEKRFQIDFIASEYRKNFFVKSSYPETVKPEIFGVDQITEEMALIPEKITKNPNAVLLQTRTDKIELAQTMKQHFNQDIEVNTWGGPANILECSPKGVHKASALKYLLSALNCSQDDLIAFGDERNDMTMLHFAKVGYAMKNANLDLLPYADEMTEYDNNDDGVARELERLFIY